MRLLRVIRAVFWSFFGVRRKGDAARDLDDVGPGTMILAGLLAALLLVGAIVALVRFVAADRATSRSAQAPQASPAAPGRPPHGPVVVADTMEERARPCATCHGAETQTTKEGFSPRTAGKPAGYLLNQLASFRDGRRGYPPMVYLVQYMTDDYLREMAAYFAKLELPYPPPERPALSVEQSKRVADLVQHGDPARDVPACVSCHGVTLSGVEPAIPSLLGLPRQYMNAQFGAWRNGKLRSVEPDCMAEVARRLAPADVPLLTAWLSSQPVPAGTKAARVASKLPLECGSLAKTQTAAAVPAAGGRGAYLVVGGDCIACHTAIGGAPFAGGRAIETPFGTVYSSNITADNNTGIGSWTRED